jgi:hypothetical protein
MRIHIRCILSAVAAGVLAGQPLVAQQAAPPRTHTVKEGDTLWDLAQQYLGDAFLWPEIYRLNRDVVEDPHWIYPGEVLRLAAGEETVAETPTEAAPAPVTVPQQAPTIFSPRSTPAAQARTQRIEATTFMNPDMPTVRLGEIVTAPFVDREGGPRGFGRILKLGDLAGIAAMSEREHFQPFDRLFIAPPVGEVAPEGQRYLSYRLGPVLEDQGQVIVPTGVVQVVQAPGSSVAAVAKVVQVFNEISATDRLIALDTAGASITARPRQVSDGATTTVKWVYGEPVLPSVQSYIVLGVSSQQGVRMGDEFEIFLPRTRGDERQLGDPEISIGVAQVVRSTPYGVTAIVLGQEQPAIREGMHARVSARMP